MSTVETVSLTWVVVAVILVFFLFPTLTYLVVMFTFCCDPAITQTFRNEVKEAEENPETGSEVKALDAPIQPVVLAFDKITYSVPTKTGEKEILKGVSGYFKPGTLSAIMGPSGCGKSTLLDILADQKHFGTIGGDVFIDGQPITDSFRRLACYVLQDDVLFPNLTVRETLWFTTQLRLSASMTLLKKHVLVDKLLEQLGLDFVADTKIGTDTTGGLSGGQKRRVSVAMELVTNPSLVFLDEPTSGLDAYGSLQVVEVLKTLTKHGRTVVCTIHQPRSDIFALFDLLLLMKLGETMFFGPCREILSYFEKLGVEVDHRVNPADFIVDLTHEKTEEEIELEIAAGTNKPEDYLVRAYETSPLSLRNKQELEKLTSEAPMNNNASEVPSGTGATNAKTAEPVATRRYITSFTQQTFTVLRRAYVNDMRNAAYISSWILGVIMFLFYGMLYSSIRPDPDTISLFDLEPFLVENGYCTQSVTDIGNQTGLTDEQVSGQFSRCGEMITHQTGFNSARDSLIYQLLAAAYFAEAPMVAQIFGEKAMFFREHNSRSYSVGAWHAAWALRMYFSGLIKGLIYPPLVYFAAGLPVDVNTYFVFSIFVASMALNGTSMALLVSTSIPSFETASVMYVVVNLVFQNLCGYFIDVSYIPPWFIWIYYINFFRYAYEGAVASLYLPFVVGESRDTLNHRVWSYALIALMFSLLFHIIAFCFSLGTYHVKSKTAKPAAPADGGSPSQAAPPTVASTYQQSLRQSCKTLPKGTTMG